MKSEWIEMPPDQVEAMADVLSRESLGSRMRIASVIGVRACRTHYPEVDPREIGLDGIEVRWVHEPMQDSHRVRYRFAQFVVERFGEPLAQKIVTPDNHR